MTGSPIALLTAVLTLAPVPGVPPGAGALPPPARTILGSLERTDPMNNQGAYVDGYAFFVQSGQVLSASVLPEGFTGRLRLRAPLGQAFEVKGEADDELTLLEVEALVTGQWTLEVTSTESRKTGNYSLDVAVTGEPFDETSRIGP